MQKYPIGIQNFEKLRNDNLLYIDKTEYIEKLLNMGSYFFLSRPRRFGKSLFLSTLKAYFEGKRELFKGLYLDSCDGLSWEPHAVILIDFNGKKYSESGSAAAMISEQLAEYEQKYDTHPVNSDLDTRFRAIIEAACEKTGKRVVVLIDEYEKPILDTLHLPEISMEHRDKLASLYSVLKSSDEYLEFCFLTGVTQFGNLNIFSGLNNLFDISLVNAYAAICGITEDELLGNFREGIEELAEEESLSFADTVKELKVNYDGYHFARVSPDIYNPFSILTVLAAKSIHPFWYKTGSPSFLVDIFKRSRVDISDIDGIEVRPESLIGASSSEKDIIAMLYQTGYLTIKSYDREFRLYKLGYPNEEVKGALLSSLLPLYAGDSEEATSQSVKEMVLDLRRGDVDGFLKRLNAIFAGFPYENVIDNEKHFQNVIYIVTTLMGLNAQIERHTSNGRIDMVIQTPKYVYIFEFKRDKSPEEALLQIEEKGYARPFASDPREIVKVGVEFSTKDRCISGWKTEGRVR